MATAVPTAPAGISEYEMQLRQLFIGASEAATILGVNPYENARDLWHRRVHGIVKEDTRLMMLGRLYEPLCLRFAAEQLGVTITRANRRRVHPNGVMQATLDGFVVGVRQIIECKKVNYFAYLKLQDDPLNCWGENFSDQIPRWMLIQVNHQLQVLTASTGEAWDEGWLSVCIGDDDFRLYHVQRDPQLCALIEQKLVEFWRNHIETEIEPTDLPLSLEILKEMDRDTAVLTDVDDTLFQDFERGKAMEEQGKEIKDATKGKLIELMGTKHDTIITKGGNKATFKKQSRSGLDQQALGRDHPDLIQKYSKSTTFPVFRTLKAKGARN